MPLLSVFGAATFWEARFQRPRENRYSRKLRLLLWEGRPTVSNCTSRRSKMTRSSPHAVAGPYVTAAIFKFVDSRHAQ
jgi:hypothetical protein